MFFGNKQVSNAEQLSSSPQISCRLMVERMKNHGGDIDDPKTDVIEVSNLSSIFIEASISPLPSLPLEPLRLESTENPSEKGGTVEITVNKVSDGQKKNISVKLSPVGSVSNLKKKNIEVGLDIPVEPEKRRKAILEQLKRLEQASEKEGRL